MKIKKIISVIVTISMLLSLCAMNIFAEDTSGAVIWQLKNTTAKTSPLVEYSDAEAYEGSRSLHIQHPNQRTNIKRFRLQTAISVCKPAKSITSVFM